MTYREEIQPETVDQTSLFMPPMAELGRKQNKMIDLIEDMDPGQLCLDAITYRGLGEVDSLQCKFSPDTEFAKDRTRGLHEPFFGRFVVNSEVDHNLPTQVAVKPFVPDSQRQGFSSPAEAVAHEWAANIYVDRLTDEGSTFVPVGIWKSEAGDPALVTIFEESVKTFDTVFYPSDDEATYVSEEKIENALSQGFRSLGILHGAGLVHVDAHVGNLGRDSRDVRFIDLETLKILGAKDGAVDVSKENRELITVDFDRFLSTMLVRCRPGDDMFKKITAVMGNAEAIESAVSHYLPGIRQGAQWSGVELPKKMIASPERLTKKIAKELDKHKKYL